MAKHVESVRQINEQLASIKQHIESNATHVVQQQPLHSHLQHTNTLNATVFACEPSTRRVLPTVSVKPKQNTQKQRSHETFQEIMSGVTSIGSVVRDTRNIRGGGILISCQNAEATMTVKQMIEKNIGDKYEIELPPIRYPRVRIMRVDINFSENEIINDIINKNDLENATIKIIKKLKHGRHGLFNDVIIEVDCDTFSKLDKTKKLCIGWRIHDVSEHCYLKRCFKCCGFGHIAKECRKKTACSKCAGEHKVNECHNTSHQCINCITINNKHKLNLSTEHHA